MTTTNDYLDAVKAKTGAVSDYSLAKILRVGHSRISNYRRGYSKFDDEIALQVASILDIDPTIVFAAVHAERAKNETEKRVWTTLFERLGGMAAAVTFGIMLNSPTDVRANEQSAQSRIQSADNLYKNCHDN